MTTPVESSSGRYHPLLQLVLARLREFLREPAAVFWVYGFPLLIALALGTAFRERPLERIKIDLRGASDRPDRVEDLRAKLAGDPRVEVELSTADNWQKRLSAGKTDLVILVPSDATKPLEFWEEPNRPESILARSAAEAAILRGEYPDAKPIERSSVDIQGSRYIDFLIPGLLGMNLMSGGLWGLGFVTVEMRTRKLLKRVLATPMKRSDFLLSLMLSRLIFTLPEVTLLLTFGYYLFGVAIQGSLPLLLLVIAMGGACFGGVGLLIASRAKTVETVSGLMNLVMLPMFVVSGIFFSSERFPEAIQPVIQALPLTALNEALRAVILEGAGFAQILPRLVVLALWGGISFAVALKIFRWE